MPEPVNETLSLDEYNRKYGGEAQPELDGLEAPHKEFEQVLAIDPGGKTGLAYTDGDRIVTQTSHFWEAIRILRTEGAGMPFDTAIEETAVVLEAPYKSRPGMRTDETAIAYRSGKVAREAELLQQEADGLGFAVIEHDPSQQGQKWDSSFARKIVGGWEGPNNEHVRDALRLLFFYNFL